MFVQIMETKGFFQFEIVINVLVFSASFEYLKYGFPVITNISILSVRGSTSSQVDPRTERITFCKFFPM